MAGTLATNEKGVPSWPKDALRISFGIIWLIDAVLKWLPGFRSGYLGMISDAGQGQPGWLHGWFSFWINLQRPEVAFFAYTVAAVETVIAVVVILGFARKLTYISAAAFSVLSRKSRGGGRSLRSAAPSRTRPFWRRLFPRSRQRTHPVPRPSWKQLARWARWARWARQGRLVRQRQHERSAA